MLNKLNCEPIWNKFFSLTTDYFSIFSLMFTWSMPFYFYLINYLFHLIQPPPYPPEHFNPASQIAAPPFSFCTKIGFISCNGKQIEQFVCSSWWLPNQILAQNACVECMGMFVVLCLHGCVLHTHLCNLYNFLFMCILDWQKQYVNQ